MDNRLLTRLQVHPSSLGTDDAVWHRGVWCTPPARTACDVARLGAPIDALATLDAALGGGTCTRRELAAACAAQRGLRGVVRLARLTPLADGRAESPMESRLRMVLLDGGLPRPVVNEPVHAGDGSFLGRPDLRIAHVLVEYDGAVHREPGAFGHDLRRQNRLVDAGFTVLRYGAGDVTGRSGLIVAQVRRALADPPPILHESTPTGASTR